MLGDQKCGQNALTAATSSTRSDPIMVSVLPQMFMSREREQILYECRHCGTEVDADSLSCPECNSNEIARFVI